MIHTIDYNSQRDNISTGGFRAYWQCFSTSVWMFMSFYSSKIIAENDNDLYEYLDDVEDSIGKPGIGEIVKRKFSWITGRTSFWWLIQLEGIKKWLHARSVKGNAFFIDNTIEFEKIRKYLDKGPLILQTKRMGGLPGGHIILAIGYTENAIICHDPFGDAVSNYKNTRGDAVVYQDSYLKKYTGNKIRFIHWVGI